MPGISIYQEQEQSFLSDFAQITGAKDRESRVVQKERFFFFFLRNEILIISLAFPTLRFLHLSSVPRPERLHPVLVTQSLRPLLLLFKQKTS